MKIVLKKTLKRSILILIFLILILFVLLNCTPKPLFSVIDLFPIEVNLTKPHNYSVIEKKSRATKDIQYSSLYPNSTLDIYSPEGATEKLPTILFVHGGGFF